jgi:hypothetical protein
MLKRFPIALLPLLLTPTTGCQRTLYDWGTYEESVYRMYASEADFSAAKEVDRLQREVERTEQRQRAIPPGKMAHLGYLYLRVGDNERARSCFERERTLFPESAHFMDFLLGRMQ